MYHSENSDLSLLADLTYLTTMSFKIVERWRRGLLDIEGFLKSPGPYTLDFFTAYHCDVASYGAETWTLRKVDQEYLGSLEMWCWRRMEMIWTDNVRNEEVLQSEGGEEYPAYNKKEEGYMDWLHLASEVCFKTHY